MKDLIRESIQTKLSRFISDNWESLDHIRKGALEFDPRRINMKDMNLYRLTSNYSGTFGVLVINDIPLCWTLEDPWDGNQKNISCIPTGTYRCVPWKSSNHGDTWMVTNVPGRDGILFHAGNTKADTEGCILLGVELIIGGIRKSKQALGEFLALMANEKSSQLTIRNVEK